MIEPLLRDIVSLVEPRLRSTGAEISLETESAGPPLWVRGDADALQSLFLNLLENAMDAAGAGGRILVRADWADQRVRIRVRDSGPGIPPALRSRVFDPFFTTKPSGTGLGLAVCKKIAEDLGGTVHLGPGPGGDVVVLFPGEEPEGGGSPVSVPGQEASSRT